MEALIRRHHDDLLRFLERLVGDKTAAQDVFQDTFLQVHVSADTFDASRRFKPWLFTIAANKARDLLRKNNRRRTLDLSAPVGGSSGSGGSGDDGQTRFIDLMEISVIQPQDAAQRVELQAAVQAAVQRLSPTLREVLLLAYFQKLSYSQIADALEIPLGTVKSRLHAAVAAFAKSWAASAPAETSDSPSVPPSRPAQSP
jgi:RNA polymerase sigma-70 factor (ECF subfamily)